jgi:hypothetical protein
MTRTTTTQPTACPSWCVGHVRRVPNATWHVGNDITVDSRRDRPSGVVLGLHQDVRRRRAPYVEIGYMYFSPAEARHIAALLVNLADMAERKVGGQS